MKEGLRCLAIVLLLFGYRDLTPKAIGAHTVGGLCAGILHIGCAF